MFLSTLKASYESCEQSGWEQLLLQPAEMRNIRTTRITIEKASGARLAFQEARNNTRVTLHGNHRARKAASLIILYRAAVPNPTAAHFNMLSAAGLVKKQTVPPRLEVAEVRTTLFRENAVFTESGRLGVLIDVTFLESHRMVQVIGADAKQRDKLCEWIRSAVEANSPQDQALVNASHASLETATPSLTRMPSLSSEVLAQRTLTTLLHEYGFSCDTSRQAVEALKDKGDIQAAVNMIVDGSMSPGRGRPDVSEVRSDSSTMGASTTSAAPTAVNVQVGNSRLVASPSTVSPRPHPTCWEVPLPCPSSGLKIDEPKGQGVVEKSSTPSPMEKPSLGLSQPEAESQTSAECAVCMEAIPDHAFAPCGHMVCCGTCAHDVIRNFGCCPVCNAETKFALHIFSVV